MNVLFLLILLHFLGDTVRSSALFNRYDAALTSVVTVTVTAPAQPAQTATDTSRGTTTTSSSSSYTDPAQLQYDALSLTNTVRQQHNASALMWNKTLAIYALNWADRCLWKHSGGPNGENLAEGFTNTTSAIAAWARESKDYDFSKPTGFSESTGHFTQLVWKATSQLGCAVADCSRNDATFRSNEDQAFGWFFVCEYWPPGNVVGDGDVYFEENVDPAVSGAVLSRGLGRRGLWMVLVVFVVNMLVLIY